jgi:1,2-diacylglycerol 3-alpha-glucosyltransferase
LEIAFFSETYLPTPDGVAHEVSSLAHALERAGHSVRVYTPNPVVGAPSERVELDGIRVTRVRSLPVPLYGQYRWALFPFPQLRGERFASDVDIVHVHTPGMMGGTGFLAARHFHKPLVGTFHTNVSQMRGSFRRDPLVGAFFRAAWWFTLGTYYRCDITTAPTDAARNALEAGGSKPFRRPIEVIPNGIEVDRFRPGIPAPDWRARCGLPEGPLVTYLGRLTLDKGVHRFLDAVASLSDRRDFSAVVAGAGPEENAVRDRLRSDARLAGRVRYLGPIAEEEKASLLAQSDLFVLPSTSDTSSLALLEAMASGATCVVSNVGGPGEMVQDGVTARRFDPAVPESLPLVLAELLDAPEARAAIAARGVAYVRATASIDQTARRFISLYELLLSERRTGAVDHAR